MKKVAVNKCFGGFGLSNWAMYNIAKKKGIEVFPYKVSYNDDYTEVKYKKIDDPKDIHNFSSEGFAERVDFFTEDPLEEEWILGMHKDNSYKVFEEFNFYPDYNRDDKEMIKVIEELGSLAERSYADIEILEIEDDEEYIVHEYDGLETLIAGKDLREVE